MPENINPQFLSLKVNLTNTKQLKDLKESVEEASIFDFGEKTSQVSTEGSTVDTESIASIVQTIVEKILEILGINKPEKAEDVSEAEDAKEKVEDFKQNLKKQQVVLLNSEE